MNLTAVKRALRRNLGDCSIHGHTRRFYDDKKPVLKMFELWVRSGDAEFLLGYGRDWAEALNNAVAHIPGAQHAIEKITRPSHE